MKYIVTLDYNNHSIGSAFYLLVQKEADFSKQIDEFLKDYEGLYFEKNHSRFVTSVHPQANGMGVILSFSIKIEDLSRTPWEPKDIVWAFTFIDPELTVSIKESE